MNFDELETRLVQTCVDIMMDNPDKFIIVKYIKNGILTIKPELSENDVNDYTRRFLMERIGLHKVLYEYLTAMKKIRFNVLDKDFPFSKRNKSIIENTLYYYFDDKDTFHNFKIDKKYY